MKFVVTGGAGFIGSSFVNLCLEKGHDVLVVDKVTYAGKLENMALGSTNLRILIKDICDVDAEMLEDYDYLVNFAAESHVDNSIEDGRPFVRTNVEGTFNLLELARKNPNLKKFIQISTDEVYGDMDDYGEGAEADETYPLIGSSYYSSTKASADLLVQAAARTYKLPYIITRTCNNFGPKQHQEKFIPKLLQNVKQNKAIGVYGDGSNKREWLYVEDNVRAIYSLLKSDAEGIFNIGSGIRYTNNEIVELAEKVSKVAIYKDYIEDRKGHDKSYALNSSKTPFIDITKTLEDYFKEQLDEY